MCVQKYGKQGDMKGHIFSDEVQCRLGRYFATCGTSNKHPLVLCGLNIIRADSFILHGAMSRLKCDEISLMKTYKFLDGSAECFSKTNLIEKRMQALQTFYLEMLSSIAILIISITTMVMFCTLLMCPLRLWNYCLPFRNNSTIPRKNGMFQNTTGIVLLQRSSTRCIPPSGPFGNMY